jgi:hypothetical protein
VLFITSQVAASGRPAAGPGRRCGSGPGCQCGPSGSSRRARRRGPTVAKATARRTSDRSGPFLRTERGLGALSRTRRTVLGVLVPCVRSAAGRCGSCPWSGDAGAGFRTPWGRRCGLDGPMPHTIAPVVRGRCRPSPDRVPQGASSDRHCCCLCTLNPQQFTTPRPVAGAGVRLGKGRTAAACCPGVSALVSAVAEPLVRPERGQRRPLPIEASSGRTGVAHGDACCGMPGVQPDP